MQQHSLVLRACTSVARKLASDLEKMEFYTVVQDVQIKHKFPNTLIGNMGNSNVVDPRLYC